MKSNETNINDCLIYEKKGYFDERGEIISTFLKNQVENLDFVEDVFTISKINVLRGFHGDHRTWKLVQCIFGSVYIVVVDVRKNSPTYRKYISLVLSEKNRKQLLIPAGCANAWLTTSDSCIFHYKKSEYYNGEEFIIPYNDKRLSITWPCKNPILSEKDKNAYYKW